MTATPMKTRRAFHHDSVGKALVKPPLAQRLADQVPHFRLVQGRQWKFCPDATVPCGLEVIVRHHHDNGVDNYTAAIVKCGEKHCNVKYRLDDGSMSEVMSCPTEHIKPYFGHLLAPGFSNQKSFNLRAMQETCLDDDTDFGLTLNDKVGVVPFNSGLTFKSDDFFTQPVTGAFSVGFTDLNLVLSAMVAQGRLQVLSNPSITVANNEDGRIQVGEEVRLPESIATFDTGTQSSTVIAQDIKAFAIVFWAVSFVPVTLLGLMRLKAAGMSLQQVWSQARS